VAIEVVDRCINMSMALGIGKHLPLELWWLNRHGCEGLIKITSMRWDTHLSISVLHSVQYIYFTHSFPKE